jgi:hypothetical protein
MVHTDDILSPPYSLQADVDLVVSRFFDMEMVIGIREHMWVNIYADGRIETIHQDGSIEVEYTGVEVQVPPKNDLFISRSFVLANGEIATTEIMFFEDGSMKMVCLSGSVRTTCPDGNTVITQPCGMVQTLYRDAG